MTNNEDPTAMRGDDTPLDPWMQELVHEVAAELDHEVEVPRDMMWARIQRERHRALPGTSDTDAPTTVHDIAAHAARRRGAWPWTRQLSAAAAVLVAGVAIGRYVVPAAAGSGTQPAGVTIADASPSTLAAAVNSDPSHVAMQEHLVRTVALLTTVRDESVMHDTTADLAPRAKELLSTTRLLLDQPQLRDERTRRLLQDLELVLVQVIQARSTAPETQRAPRETLRETNLLTRVNALVTAAAITDAAIYGGD